MSKSGACWTERSSGPSSRIRCGDRDKANDKLSGVCCFSWGVESKEETFRAAEVIFGHKALDIFIREGLTEFVNF